MNNMHSYPVDRDWMCCAQCGEEFPRSHSHICEVGEYWNWLSAINEATRILKDSNDGSRTEPHERIPCAK